MNIDEVIKHEFIDKINVNSRTIGVEIELPLISNNEDKIIKIEDIKEMFLFLNKNGFETYDKDLDNNCISVVNEQKDKISLEYSLNTIEFSINKSENLYDLYYKFHNYFKLINNYIKRFNYELIGSGINPNYKKINRKCLNEERYNMIEKLLLSKPYNNNRLFGEFCSYICSIQTHISPNKDTLITLLNVFNSLVEIKTDIFANSYMEELKSKNSRNLLWENSNFGKLNTGKIPNVRNIQDIINMYKNSYMNIIQRDNKYLLIPKIKVNDYYNSDILYGIDYNNNVIKIIPQEEDFKYYRAYRNIELTRHGTLEIRSDCTQRVENIFNVVAFNVGIWSNIEEAKRNIKNRDKKKWIEIARRGLYYRSKGEEKLLNI